MASEGASCAAGELEQQQPPPQLPPPAPIQTLATTVLGSVDAKCEFNMDNLSKPELLTLLSIMEGELEARDLVIEALRARRKEVFLQERYGQYNLTDPFLALQRDYEGGGPLGGPDKDRRGVGPSPMAVLEAVMAHCRKMQERMAAQLAAAERREKRLELEKLQLQSLETEHRKLTAQLKDEREKNKHIVMMLVRECKQLATRVVEESGRFDELQARLDAESRASGGLREELGAERQRSQQMEAKMEKQLSEFDTEREQLRARLGREEAESQSLRRQVERLRTESSAAAATTATPQPAGSAAGGAEPAGAKPTPSAAAKPLVVSVAVQATEPSLVSSRQTCQTASRSCQTDSPPASAEVAEGGGGGRKTPQTPVKPAPANYVGLSLPKTPGRAPQTENGSEGQPLHGAPSGVSPRVQAARYKFQEQDQNGTANQSPPGSARDLSPTNRDNFAAKQQARHTVTQVLSRFTSPPAGGGGGSGGSLRPGLPHSASEGGPFPLGRLSHPIGLKSPTVARIDRGNPPPIPPKKPGLSQTPSAPHPPIKMAGEGGRSQKAATPQLPPKPSLDLVPALTASQVGAGAAAACAECPLLPIISPPIINPSPSSPTASSSSSPSSSASAPSSRSSRAPAGIPLATASGWCTSVVVLPLDAGGGPAAALDSGRPPLLLQAASQGNVTLLSMLLNQPDPTTDTTTTTTTDTTMTTDDNDEDTTTTTVDNNTPSHHNHQQLHVHQTSALFAAARNGYTDCVRLLLNSGVSTDVLDENGFTPLHFASTYGHCGCVEVLLASGADVDHRGASSGHQTALYMASDTGSMDCVRALLNGGADRAHTTADGCTALHAAVRSGHVDTLRLLLCHPVPASLTSDPAVAHPAPLALPAALLNQANTEGWTAAHMAAARGFKECLEVLFSHSEQDIDRRDKCNRTIHDVATDDCKDLLENLDSYRVQVCVQLSSPAEGGGGGGGEGGVVVEPMCLLQEEEEEEGGASGRRTGRRWAVLGRVCVERSTRWSALSLALGHAFTSHLQLLCCRDRSPSPSYPSPSAPPALLAGRDDSGPSSLGLGPASIASVLIGDTAWLPGQELPLSPWDLVRKPHSQRIMLRLKGLSESCLDELAVDSLFPLPLLHNYVRLVEQYGNLIFHGLEGSCQEYIANQIARCIKAKQEAGGVCCDVVRVEVDESLTKEQLLETFITCGFLVPAVGVVSAVRGHSVVVLLEGLEKASSLPGLLGDLCHSLDNRGAACPLALPTGPHYFREGCFLIGTLSKTRLQGSELRLQQHFRWVTLRWDQEPLHGLLGRHLRRKLLHKTGAGVWCWDGALERSALWVSRVWQQLNACLSRLGTHEALLGPRLFLSCPVVPHNTQAVVKWLVRLWNAVVVPRVEEAIVSRVTAKRPSPSSSSPSSPPPASRRASSGSHGLTSGQQAVVKAALSILVNKAVLLGCPLPRHEIDRHLLEFQGGSFPMSAIGSCKGSSTAGGRKGRDSGQWRRANTSPRKKGSPASSNWSCGGPLREGSLSTTDVRFTNGDSQRLAVGEPTGLSVFSDDETDLIRELTSMCSSKSEPDISKMAQSKDDLDVVYSSADPHRPDQEGSPQPRTQTPSSSSSSSRPSSRGPASSSPSPASERRGQAPGGRPAKSQLPVPSSRGQQQQPRASSSSSSTSGVSGSGTGSQTTLSNRTAASRTESSSKTRPVPSGSNLHLHQQHHRNNNIVNGNSQPTHHEDIWVLHRDLHQNSINNNK